MRLHEYDQWGLWGFDYLEAKRLLDRFGNPIGSDQHSDLTSWEVVADIVENRRLVVQGPCFVFTQRDPFVGIDLDDCLDEEMQLKPWAVPIVERFSGTYMEISPSLQGIKIFAEGNIRDGWPAVRRFDDGQVEIYSSGRYFTFTENQWPGCHHDVTPQQEAIEWLYDTFYFLPVEQPRIWKDGLTQAGSDLNRRAQQYVANADRPLPGGRNICCLRLAGHIMAIGTVDGEVLNDEEVSYWVHLWNASLPAPMACTEVDRIVRNARNSPTPRPLKIYQPIASVTMHEGVDLSGIMGSSPAEPAEEPAGTTYCDLPIELLAVPGFIGQVVDFIEATCFFHQPVLALAAAIALQGALAGRKVHCRFGNRPNVYCLGLVRTGGGKDRPRDVANDILQQSGAWAIGGLENPKSGASICSAMAKYPARLMLIDEFGRYVRFARASQQAPWAQEILDNLLKLYSAGRGKWSGANYADSRKDIEVDRPSLSLFGTSVPDNLWDNLTIDAARDGLLSRMLLFTGYDRPMKGPRCPNEPIPESILEHAKKWFNNGNGNLADQALSHSEVLVPHTDAALDLANKIMDDESTFERFNTFEEQAIASRVGQNTCKLALIYACSENADEPVITLEAVQWAYGIADYCRKQMLQAIKQIPENEYSKRLIKVTNWLSDREGRCCTMNEFSAKWRNWTPKERRDVLEGLIETQMVQQERQDHEGAGRPRTILRLTGQ
jgi:hypothetical protein